MFEVEQDWSGFAVLEDDKVLFEVDNEDGLPTWDEVLEGLEETTDLVALRQFMSDQQLLAKGLSEEGR